MSCPSEFGNDTHREKCRDFDAHTDTPRTIAVGVFDGVHAGHRKLIEKVIQTARTTASLACILTFSSHPLQLIAPNCAPKTLTPIEERRRLILDAGIDEVVVLDFDENLRNLTAQQFLAFLSREYRVRHLVMGFNNRFGRDCNTIGVDYPTLAARFGITIEYADEVSLPQLDLHVSSSSIRECLTSGKIEEATRMLTRPYSVTGTVVHGRGRGASIGFPTANLAPLCATQLIPGSGVYACRAEIDERKLPAVVNIGTCPTLTPGLITTIEAHIIGLTHDIYGHHLKLTFVHRLRDEKKFATPAALITQIALDTSSALKIIEE